MTSSVWDCFGRMFQTSSAVGAVTLHTSVFPGILGTFWGKGNILYVCIQCGLLMGPPCFIIVSATLTFCKELPELVIRLCRLTIPFGLLGGFVCFLDFLSTCWLIDWLVGGVFDRLAGRSLYHSGGRSFIMYWILLDFVETVFVYKVLDSIRVALYIMSRGLTDLCSSSRYCD